MPRRRVTAVIQARTGSTRLPSKVLRPLGSSFVLGWVVRAALTADGVDDVVIATSEHPGDDPIAEGDTCGGQCQTMAADKKSARLFTSGATGITVWNVGEDGALAAVAGSAARRGRTVDLEPRDLLPLSAATFALSKLVVHEKVESWVRAPFVEEHPQGARPKGRRLRYAVGELLSCTRCMGAWGALGLVALRTESPARKPGSCANS